MIKTEGAIEFLTHSTDPIEDELIISNLTSLRGKEVSINSGSNLILAPLSSIKSEEIVLNGRNCEIHEGLDSRKVLDWISKKFNPSFKFSGTCEENALPNNLSINASKLEDNQTFKLSVNDVDFEIRWIVNGTEYSGNNIRIDFPYPGMYPIKAIVIDKRGRFKRISKNVEVGINKLKNKNVFIFQYHSLLQPKALTVKINGANYRLDQSILDQTLYTTVFDISKSGPILFEIPSIKYKTNTVGEPSRNISNVDQFITNKLNLINEMLNKLGVSGERYKILKNVSVFIESRISAMNEMEKKQFAEILDSNWMIPEENKTTKNSILKKLFNSLLISSAYGDESQETPDIISEREMNLFTTRKNYETYICNAGTVTALVLASLAKDPMVQSVGVLTALGIILMCTTDAKAAQEVLSKIYVPSNYSLEINPIKLRSEEEEQLKLTAEYIPADLDIWGGAFINNPNIQKVGKIKKEINESLLMTNKAMNMGYLGGIFKGAEIPLLITSSLTFRGQISANYIRNITINNTQYGGVSIVSFFAENNLLKLNIKSNRSQRIGLFFQYSNALVNPPIKYFHELEIEAPPKAIINYSTDGLDVSFDAIDSSNPNVVGLTYEWDFGDGKKQITSSKTIVHKYETTGIYNVKLKVTDQDGISSDDTTVLDLRGINYSIFMQVNVLGTYLFVDEVGGYQENGNFIKDKKVPPTVLDLTQLYSQIKLREGDKIVLQAAGLHIPGPGWGNVAEGLNAVFLDANGNFLMPGSDGEFNGVPTPPTYPKNIPTDIPQDFHVPTLGSTMVQIPLGAKGIAFSPNDSYFADNSDPDNDYGVRIKITVIRNPEVPFN